MQNGALEHATFWRSAADGIFVLHVAVVLIVLFGWLFPRCEAIYLTTLIATLVSELALGYCVLINWEFSFRKKAGQDVSTTRRS